MPDDGDEADLESVDSSEDRLRGEIGLEASTEVEGGGEGPARPRGSVPGPPD